MAYPGVSFPLPVSCSLVLIAPPHLVLPSNLVLPPHLVLPSCERLLLSSLPFNPLVHLLLPSWLPDLCATLGLVLVFSRPHPVCCFLLILQPLFSGSMPACSPICSGSPARVNLLHKHDHGQPRILGLQVTRVTGRQVSPNLLFQRPPTPMEVGRVVHTMLCPQC